MSADTLHSNPTTPISLDSQIELVANNPVADGVLHSVGGVLAILNENNRVISVNEAFMVALGIEDPKQVLGLKPGHALDCVHAAEGPDGCGSSEFCPSCGTAIAIVTSLAQDGQVERICALTAEKHRTRKDLALRVQAQPIRFQGHRFILLMMQDITIEQQRAALERSFYHDLNNYVMGLQGTCELLEEENPEPGLIRQLCDVSHRLAQEVEIQKSLFQAHYRELKVHLVDTDARQLLQELKATLSRHPAAKGRRLDIRSEIPQVNFRTDLSLCLRVLTNMVINALEATDEGGKIELQVKAPEEAVVFSVWNGQVIPEAIQPRIFQRHFSTKDAPGRGFGTHSMKLFGETYLGGKVDFQSPVRGGTVFRFEIPLEWSGP